MRISTIHFILVLILHGTVLSFLVPHHSCLHRRQTCDSGSYCRPTVFLASARYGPPTPTPGSDTFDDEGESLELAKRKSDFRKLLEQAIVTTDRNHLPQLLARNLDLILSLQGEDGSDVISELIEEAHQQGPQVLEQTLELMEHIMIFAEGFVEQAIEMDNANKKLLGKVIRTMTSDPSIRDREELLDELMEQEKNNFTPGFLRHLEGECDRIANAPKMTPESARLLEILRIIQTRVLEELGKEMGDAALVLGQLMGYENDNELLGVLDAGLTVRGTDFAKEMVLLTEEALEGFQQVPGGVDTELVDRVTLIRSRLRTFIDGNNDFQ